MLLFYKSGETLKVADHKPKQYLSIKLWRAADRNDTSLWVGHSAVDMIIDKGEHGYRTFPL